MNNHNFDVLIVEDSLSYAIVLERMCKEIGLSVIVSVADSASALDIIFAEYPDLILMDNNIGGMLRGEEVGKEIDHLGIPTSIHYFTWRNQIWYSMQNRLIW